MLLETFKRFGLGFLILLGFALVIGIIIGALFLVAIYKIIIIPIIIIVLSYALGSVWRSNKIKIKGEK